MAISSKRFELALRNISASDWALFEKLCAAFLASEWADVRTMASSSGDGGRDSALFCPTGDSQVAIQFSVQVDWKSKIRNTIRRLKATYPDSRVLVFMSSQIIGAHADDMRRSASSEGLYLDVRDRNWFLERVSSSDSRNEAAAVLARQIVDPLLEDSGVIRRSSSSLSGSDARTAFVFLEMQWKDEASEKGLTRSCFESLVRAALRNARSTNPMPRSSVYTAIYGFLPSHSADQLRHFIDAALTRLSRGPISHIAKTDSFYLTDKEADRIKDSAASLQLLNESLEADIRDIASNSQGVIPSQVELIVSATREIIQSYFLKKGEEFAVSLTRDRDFQSYRMDDLKSQVMNHLPTVKICESRDQLTFLTEIVTNLLSTPSDATSRYLSNLSDSYTLFAFLAESPDVQKVTKKLFGHGEIWLDTSVLLPLFAEIAYPSHLRPFSSMFSQSRRSGLKLLVTFGIIEEIERHLNLCLIYARSERWQGRVPYVVGRFLLAGRSLGTFPAWVEQFAGSFRREEDISQYLSEDFGITVERPNSIEEIPTDVAHEIVEYWRAVQQRRRGYNDLFDIATNRLADHDSENFLSVLASRLKDHGKSPLGYSSWWLTLDGAASEILKICSPETREFVRHSPIMSLDFLLKYLAFGPNRDRVDSEGQAVARTISGAFLESIPPELLAAADEARAEYRGLPERVIQRRIRDALDREKAKRGPVQSGGLDKADEAIASMF